MRNTGKKPIVEMGRPFNTNTTHTNIIYNTQIKFLQINLMHSRVDTSNLLKIVDEDGTDMVLSRKHTSYTTKLLLS